MSRKPKVFNTLKLDKPQFGKVNVDLEDIVEEPSEKVVTFVQVSLSFLFLFFRSGFLGSSTVQRNVNHMNLQLASKDTQPRMDFLQFWT